MDPWICFSVIVTVQIIIFFILALLRQQSARSIIHCLLFGAIVGSAIGFVFDIAVGSLQDVFVYYIPQTIGFTLVNGVLSYGTAMATASVFPVDLQSIRTSLISHLKVRDTFAVILLLVLSTILLVYRMPSAVLRIFVVGCVIIAIGEFVALLYKRLGPIFQALGGDYRAIASLWLFSVVVGLAYELTNHFFPVWVWVSLSGLPQPYSDVLIVGFGYVVLFHPMLVIARLICLCPATTGRD